MWEIFNASGIKGNNVNLRYKQICIFNIIPAPSKYILLYYKKNNLFNWLQPQITFDAFKSIGYY